LRDGQRLTKSTGRGEHHVDDAGGELDDDEDDDPGAPAADGRTGWSARYGYVYNHGVWGVGAGDKYNVVQVDLETGELGHMNVVCENAYRSHVRRWTTASDAAAVNAGEPVEDLDAAAVLDGLQKHVNKYPNPPNFYTADQWAAAENRRLKILAEGRITPTSYRRKQ
jgi:hypothetical protein